MMNVKQAQQAVRGNRPQGIQQQPQGGGYQRISPGMYKGPNGQVVKSATNPGRKAPPVPPKMPMPAPGQAFNPGGALGPGLGGSALGQPTQQPGQGYGGALGQQLPQMQQQSGYNPNDTDAYRQAMQDPYHGMMNEGLVSQSSGAGQFGQQNYSADPQTGRSNLYMNPSQVGSVFNQLANQNRAAQAQLQGAQQPQAQGGMQQPQQTWQQYQQGQMAQGNTQSPLPGRFIG